MLEPLRGRQGMATQIREFSMSEDLDALELKRTFVESICLECGLTPERLEGLLLAPGFGAYGRPDDWRAFVPPEIVEAWPCLTPDALIVAFYMAHTQFLKEMAG
jgi:hypothetical protein